MTSRQSTGYKVSDRLFVCPPPHPAMARTRMTRTRVTRISVTRTRVARVSVATLIFSNGSRATHPTRAMPHAKAPRSSICAACPSHVPRTSLARPMHVPCTSLSRPSHLDAQCPESGPRRAAAAPITPRTRAYTHARTHARSLLDCMNSSPRAALQHTDTHRHRH